MVHLSNLSKEEAIEFGSKVAALIGLGIEGEEGMEAGAELGAEVAAEGGIQRLLRRGGVGHPRGDPQRLRGGADPARAPLGSAAARRDPARRRHRPRPTASSIRRIWSRSASPLRRRPRSSVRCIRARRQRSEPANPISDIQARRWRDEGSQSCPSHVTARRAPALATGHDVDVGPALGASAQVRATDGERRTGMREVHAKRALRPSSEAGRLGSSRASTLPEAPGGTTDPEQRSHFVVSPASAPVRTRRGDGRGNHRDARARPAREDDGGLARSVEPRRRDR